MKSNACECVIEGKPCRGFHYRYWDIIGWVEVCTNCPFFKRLDGEERKERVELPEGFKDRRKND